MVGINVQCFHRHQLTSVTGRPAAKPILQATEILISTLLETRDAQQGGVGAMVQSA